MAKTKASSKTPPRGQKSLTSFFGAPRSSKTGNVIATKTKKVQSGIQSSFRRQQAAAAAADNNDDNKNGSARKEEVSTNKKEGRGDDQESVAAATSAMKENDDNGAKKITSSNNSDDYLKKNDNDDNASYKATKKNATTAKTSVSSAAAAARSSSTTPYSALCDTFSAIEEISSRLEIQEKLTELFRLVLLQEGGGDDDQQPLDHDNDGVDGGNDDKVAKSDLYTLLYLASNSVAPQHDNVELGVGDSILIKAIGEASGTNPQMIKKKYDTDGDLGTVAQTSKGRQKTLMFGKMSSGPKRLNCVDVLTVFREIANVSGSQSQKWKVDKIKSLLVRAKGVEPKYIIRGLQGKLRIGLAQTTVLASLAHAVVLTRPRGVELLGEGRLKEICDLDGKEGAYPDFARKMCTKNLPLDVKLETAVAIIKKAYSEVPSFDSLLDALLSVPLQEVHKACTLKPFSSNTDADKPPPLPTPASTTDAVVGLVNVNRPALLSVGNNNDMQQACAAGVSSEQGKDGNPFGLGKPEALHNLKPASTSSTAYKKFATSTSSTAYKKLATKKRQLENAEDKKERWNEKLARAIDEEQKSAEELEREKDDELMDRALEPMAKAVGILESSKVLSVNTTELKNNRNKLQPNTDASFPQQRNVALSANNVARVINMASLRCSNPDHLGATFGSGGTRKNVRKKKVDAAWSDVQQLKYADWKEKGKGIAKNNYNWEKKIPEFAFKFKGEIDMELLDGNGDRVTEEDYKKKDGHKKVRSFELANAEAYEKLRGKTRLRDKKPIRMNGNLTDTENYFHFEMIRYDKEGILGDTTQVGSRNKRRQTARYRYTIADNAKTKYFAPYEKLDLGRED